MNLFLFFAFIHISLGNVNSEKNEHPNFENQIKTLQVQVDLQFQYLKEIYFNKTGQSFKADYLSDRGVYLRKESPDPGLKEIDEKFYTFFKGVSSQVVNDFRELYVTLSDRAIFQFAKSVMLGELRILKATNFILNVSYVEQNQKNAASKMNPMEYEFNRVDYNECLELFEMDISKKLSPDLVSRLISLCKLRYGNRTDIETALSYLYGSATNSTNNV